MPRTYATKRYAVWTQETRKSCRCCGRLRCEGETFSQKGQCPDCSAANLVAALLGMRVSEHWTEDESGKRANHHAVMVENVE